MPTQFQLEGPDLEGLLTRVRAEHGAGARIVQAEKVRTGGVGGFFAKQHFEIVVELDAIAAAAPAPVARVTSLLDLADEVSDAERASAPSLAAVSTESTGFAAVLARLGATAGEEPQAAPMPQQRRPSDPLPNRPAAAPRPRRPATTRTSAATRPAAGSAVTVRTVPAPGARRPASTQLAVRPAATVTVRPPKPSAKPSAVARTTGALQVAGRIGPLATQRVDAQLAGLGLPTHLQPSDSGGALRPALARSLRALPKPPRPTARAGAVLAVVGPLPHAQEVATQMATELGLPRAAVVRVTGSATGHRAVQELRRRGETWRRRRHATLVVVDSPLTAAGALRARAVLQALEPTATWGVIEATRKTRDVGAWAQAVGSVDALALTCIDETADPAAVLELGIPVGRIGARKATPAQWATLLSERMVA